MEFIVSLFAGGSFDCVHKASGETGSVSTLSISVTPGSPGNISSGERGLLWVVGEEDSSIRYSIPSSSSCTFEMPMQSPTSADGAVLSPTPTSQKETSVSLRLLLLSEGTCS